MNNKIIEELVELEIYKSKSLDKEQYEKLSKNNTDNSKKYISGSYNDDVDNEFNKYYKEIDTNGLSVEEVKLQLDINKTKNIKSIKNMITFFAVVTVIGLICLFFFWNVIIRDVGKFKILLGN